MRLQDEVLNHLKSQGKQYLFFPSSEEDVRQYIKSEDSIVTILKNGDDIASVCYFTFNHSVYNNLTLYIKNSAIYKDYIFSYYNVSTLMSTYMRNNWVYKSLRETGIITTELLSKIREKVANNDFFENDPLRQYLSEILASSGILNDIGYPWLVASDLPLNDEAKRLTREYDEFISYFQYKYISQPKVIKNKLFDLSDENVGELDTYFSSPKYRNQGYASTLINWTIKRAVARKNIIAMSATAHPDNIISKHILTTLNFETFCTVERRKNAPRDIMFKLIN